MEHKQVAHEISRDQSCEDIMACVISFKTFHALRADMPRSLPKNKLGGFYAGLEPIKNGKACDKRYKHKLDHR